VPTLFIISLRLKHIKIFFLILGKLSLHAVGDFKMGLFHVWLQEGTKQTPEPKCVLSYSVGDSVPELSPLVQDPALILDI
jgi:hypothetical protein